MAGRALVIAMLKRIRLKDFKSFVDEEVEVAPLTLLVGANASGKSNFLDAIRFLKGIASDLSLGDVLNGETKSAWPGIRGRAEEAARLGTKEFTLETTWTASDSAEIPHQVTCFTSHLEVKEESFLKPEERLLGGGRPGDFKRVWGLTDISNRIRDQNALYSSLRRLQFLGIDPSSMRGYGRRDEPLGEDGRNISGVLANLCEDVKEKQSFVAWLTEFCAPEIENIDFPGVPELGDVMAVFVEKGGKRISARSISDGTLHFLGTLLALRTAEPGSVILIEEIEAGLHPTRIRLLVEYLETVTRERQIQVIATTHSPVVLQWLSDESLRNAIVFGRVPDHEGTVMRRLGDLPHFNEVVERAGIEEMFTTGWLEMAL
jgi:predicted ATPase